MGDAAFQPLVSPHGFDGRGPVPTEVTEASKTMAVLRVKFIGQWGPGSELPLTGREVDQLFEAAAVCAEWSRELREAVGALSTTEAALAESREKFAKRDAYCTQLIRECAEEAHAHTAAEAERVAETEQKILYYRTWQKTEAALAESRGENETLKKQIGAALGLHWKCPPHDLGNENTFDICGHDDNTWPCPTVEALTPLEAPHEST